MSLSRQQFGSACKAYIHKYSTGSTDDEVLARYPSSWLWKEHNAILGLGYLERTVSLAQKQEQHEDYEEDLLEDLVEEDATQEMHDSSARSCSVLAHLTCRQYVVFSSTYQVPAFYFSVHHRTGAPLALREIVASPLFRPQMLPKTRLTTFALDIPDSAFALLSQGDHPTLGTPCWYLHPCRTAEVVEEIMKEVECADGDRPLRWLEAWFMVMSNLVDFGQTGR